MTKIIEHYQNAFEGEKAIIPIGNSCCKEICKMINETIIPEEEIKKCYIQLQKQTEEIGSYFRKDPLKARICLRNLRHTAILKDMRLTLKEKGICRCIE